MVDTLETAAACGLSLKPQRRDEPTLPDDAASGIAAAGRLRPSDRQLVSADLRAEQPESRARAPDAYPFVLSPAAVAKLRFVDDVVGRANSLEEQISVPIVVSRSRCACPVAIPSTQ